ncbi:hypothetical protein MHUMG1_08227 [Metarhizium humberi]|uniref:Uncharacterized protein n=1 Tax=Metarhizium humberi TaxID=2596975 RepID=A0A9P8M8A4_9HYPO|nr:hypothetical protein MHUMG1_08227 [Metarhizium humberi]
MLVIPLDYRAKQYPPLTYNTHIVLLPSHLQEQPSASASPTENIFSTAVKNKSHALPILRLHGMTSRPHAVSVRNGQARPPIKQRLHDLNPRLRGSIHEWCFALHILGVDARARLKQHLDLHRMPILGRPRQRSSSLGIRDVRTDAQRQQGLHQIRTAAPERLCKHETTVQLVNLFARPVFKQHLHHLHVPNLDRLEKRRGPRHRRRVHVHPARREQNPHQAEVVLPGGEVKRRLPVAIAPRGIPPASHQEDDGLVVRRPGRQHDRRAPVPAEPVIRVRARLHEQPDHVEVAAPARRHERRLAVAPPRRLGVGAVRDGPPRRPQTRPLHSPVENVVDVPGLRVPEELLLHQGDVQRRAGPVEGRLVPCRGELPDNHADDFWREAG